MPSLRRRATPAPDPAAHDVYVLGTTYSGSTLLGNALNGHPSIFHAGEVSRLPAFGLGPEAHGCMLCRIRGIECPVWTAEALQQVQAAEPPAAMAAIRARTGAPVVVDSSKYADWMRRATAGPDGLARSIRVLVTLRSPFAFAASVRRTDGLEAWEAGNIWRDTVFDALRLLNEFALPFLVVRYEQLAFEPEPLLRRVCDFLSLPWDPQLLRFWEADSHAVGGNPHAYVWYPGYHEGVDYCGEFAADRSIGEDFRERTFGGWVDERWRGEMGEAEIDQVMGTPMLPSMAAMAGYNLRALLGG
jgi:hypothetical protein